MSYRKAGGAKPDSMSCFVVVKSDKLKPCADDMTNSKFYNSMTQLALLCCSLQYQNYSEKSK